MGDLFKGDIKASEVFHDFNDINFIQILLIIFGAYLLIFGIRKSFPYLAERGPSNVRHYLLGLIPALRLLIVIGAILWIIPMVVEVNLRNFVVIFGAASVAIGFAFKDFVSSIVAGIVAIFERPYRPGDWIKIDQDEGEVVDVGLRTLTINTQNDNLVIIPQNVIWAKSVINGNDGQSTMLCAIDFYVAPNQDDSGVRQALQDVALTSAYLSYAHPVAVGVKADDEMGIRYTIRAFPVDFRDQFVFASDLTERGKQTLYKMGIKQVSRSNHNED